MRATAFGVTHNRPRPTASYIVPVRQLNNDIRAWINTWNDNPRSYVWTKTAGQILASVGNYCTRINDSGHQDVGVALLASGVHQQASISDFTITSLVLLPRQGI
jgi:hypothetical protein